jgi:hypothetical protein
MTVRIVGIFWRISLILGLSFSTSSIRCPSGSLRERFPRRRLRYRLNKPRRKRTKLNRAKMKMKRSKKMRKRKHKKSSLLSKNNRKPKFRNNLKLSKKAVKDPKLNLIIPRP